jgi:hypothetical protein
MLGGSKVYIILFSTLTHYKIIKFAFSEKIADFKKVSKINHKLSEAFYNNFNY